MPEFMYHLSDSALFSLLAGALIAVSMVIIAIIRVAVPHELRMKENAVIGAVSATISVIFGVLSGLVALYLINSINYASDAVQREANAAANIWRDTSWLDSPARDAMRSEVRQYLTRVIQIEWPAMNRGETPDGKASEIIQAMSDSLRDYSGQHPGAEIVANVLSGIKDLYDARHLRINSATMTLGAEIWLVILIGSFLTLAVNFLYGMNLYLHMLSSAAAALMVASILFLMITLDRPFQGEFGVQPDGLTRVLDRINSAQ